MHEGSFLRGAGAVSLGLVLGVRVVGGLLALLSLLWLLVLLGKEVVFVAFVFVGGGGGEEETAVVLVAEEIGGVEVVAAVVG